MNRLLSALKADFLFQFKQGFYFVYVILSILYLIVFHQLDQQLVKLGLPIIVYTDPSVLGLFFIGGILLLEKEQGILALIYVTPLRIGEFILSKLLSLCFLSLVAVLTISLIAYQGSVHYSVLIIGICLTSSFYTLFGFIYATKSKSVNAFFIKIVPIMLLLFLPCIAMFVFPTAKWLNIIPSIASLRLIWGAYSGISLQETLFCSLYLLMITYLLYLFTYKTFRDHMVIES